jgi:heme-degrading monooxygenase HmoA
MGTISTTPKVYTLVNVFAVDKNKQVELYDHLVEVTETLIKDLPGFISANFHLSHDGQHVVNYAQWESEEHFRAMHSNSRLREHFTFCRSISTPKSIPCDVSHVCEK